MLFRVQQQPYLALFGQYMRAERLLGKTHSTAIGELLVPGDPSERETCHIGLLRNQAPEIRNAETGAGIIHVGSWKYVYLTTGWIDLNLTGITQLDPPRLHLDAIDGSRGEKHAEPAAQLAGFSGIFKKVGDNHLGNAPDPATLMPQQ